MDNKSPSIVYLRDCLKDIPKDKYRLPIILGVDTNGNTVVKDLKEMNNLLIAGFANTGKSVLISSILATLASLNTPEKLNFLLASGFVSAYEALNESPYLYSKVMYFYDEIYKALQICMEEVRRRESNKINNPYLVIVIDEFASLIRDHGDEMGNIIYQLVKRGNDVGVYLIVSTMKPDSKVIPEKIRKVFHSRIAFATNLEGSQRVLDQAGAEKIEKTGEILFKNKVSEEVVRIQTPYISIEDFDEIFRGKNV
jgi:DNA segregation ATPase FtsK/SpoIIIE-like protein